MIMLVAVPYEPESADEIDGVPELATNPVGKTVSTSRPYWRTSRRMSPRRWPVSHVQYARSWK